MSTKALENENLPKTDKMTENKTVNSKIYSVLESKIFYVEEDNYDLKLDEN